MSIEKAPKSQTEQFDEDIFYNEVAEQDFLFRLFEQGIGHEFSTTTNTTRNCF